MRMKRVLFLILLLTTLVFSSSFKFTPKVEALCDCIANPNCSDMCPNQPPPCGGMWQPPCFSTITTVVEEVK